jgi:hypothetical protein
MDGHAGLTRLLDLWHKQRALILSPDLTPNVSDDISVLTS